MNEFDATWSQDVTRIGFGRQGGHPAIYLLDVKARQVATLPDSNGLFSPRLVAGWAASSGLICGFQEAFSFRFEVPEWSEWTDEPAAFSYPTWSRDGAFLQYDTLAGKPTLRRIKVGQAQLELLLDLQSLNRYTDSIIGTWSGLAADGSALVVLDRSTQEVYALELEAQ